MYSCLALKFLLEERIRYSMRAVRILLLEILLFFGDSAIINSFIKHFLVFEDGVKNKLLICGTNLT